MLILNPNRVRFAGQEWRAVTSVAIDRSAVMVIEDRGQAGPFATLVDVPQERITIRVAAALHADDLGAPACGALGDLEIWCAPNASQARRTRLIASAVVTSVRHDLHARAPASAHAAATRHITLQVMSADGKADPIDIADASTGPD